MLDTTRSKIAGMTFGRKPGRFEWDLGHPNMTVNGYFFIVTVIDKDTCVGGAEGEPIGDMGGYQESEWDAIKLAVDEYTCLPANWAICERLVLCHSSGARRFRLRHESP